MVASPFPYNPFGVVNAPGTFTVQTDGDVQGTYFDDPAVRFALRTGVVSDSEIYPMWGGIGVSELIPTVGVANPDQSLGAILGRATTLTGTSSGGLSGFTVFNQAHNMLTAPQSPVPLAGSRMTISYFRLGSGARIAVACDPSLVDLEGNVVGSQVSWDFNAQRLAPYETTATYALTSAAWANTNGGRLTIVASVATPVAAVGDAITISGATNSGTGGASAINTTFIVDTFTDNEHFTVAAPASAGVFGTIGGSPELVYGTGALACRIDRISTGNSMIVAYDPTTNIATWNYSGASAVIQI